MEYRFKFQAEIAAKQAVLDSVHRQIGAAMSEVNRAHTISAWGADGRIEYGLISDQQDLDIALSQAIGYLMAAREMLPTRE